MQKWKKIDGRDILDEEGLKVYSNSDYYIFQNINTGYYRVTVHDNSEEKRNIVQDYMYKSDVEFFFGNLYEEDEY